MDKIKRDSDADNLNGFRTHGVTFTSGAGNQLIGDCLLCGKEGHFYVNKENKLWDCKRCGEHGNFEDFLHAVAKLREDSITEDRLLELAQNRGLPISAVRGYGIGFEGDRYTLPVRNSKGRCIDIRLFRLGHKLLSTPTSSTGLFNVGELVRPENLRKHVYLCEGEWDTMAMGWLLRRVGVDAIAVGVPGASTFKQTWAPLFENRSVDVLYDNDVAGENGELAVYNKLNGMSKKLRFIQWGPSFTTGYDVRDLIKELAVKQGKPQNAFDTITSLLKDRPRLERRTQSSETVPSAGAVGTKEDFREPLEPITVDDLLGEYKKWLHLSSMDPLKVMYGTVLANQLGGDPLWLFLVAPPGGSKSEFLMSLAASPLVHALSSLTPHTLISGANWKEGGDPSLLPQLAGKILIIKDFTTILTMHYTARDEIFGTLRDVYDGQTEKVFGNGLKRKYNVRFGILAGVTPSIETFNVMHQSLGERFLKFRISGNWDQISEEDKILRALNNIGQENQMREELQKAGSRYLANLPAIDLNKLPEIDDEFKMRLVHLAKFSARLRGVVERDKFTSSVLYKPSSEVGTRIAKQLAKLGQGIALFLGKKKLDDEIYRMVRRVALDTVPDRVEDIVREIWKQNGAVGGSSKTAEIVAGTRLPQSTVFRVLQDLNLLRIVETRPGGVASWKLSDTIVGHIQKAKLYEQYEEKWKGPSTVVAPVKKLKARVR